MKIYNMDDSPLDLAVKNADHHNHDKMTQKFSHSTDNLTSLAPSGSALTSVIVENLDKVSLEQSGLHQLAVVAEMKQQEEEEMMDLSPNTGHVLMDTSGQDTPRACTSPILKVTRAIPAPSPDSAIHSAIYSPSQSPVQSRHGPLSGFSSPYPSSSHKTSPSLSRNNSDVSQYSLSPSMSPVPGSRYSNPASHPGYPSPAFPSSPLPRSGAYSTNSHPVILPRNEDSEDLANIAAAQTGISRQQLINSPCPVCTDKISGFHYGIFSCESCKGFFKRTVQNKKNYVCLRGAQCPVTINTRKKCPACRFDKCLKMGMKLEAIREDRTRGGRSTYQCSYTLPPGIGPLSGAQVPSLLQEIMDVEHLWFSGKGGNGNAAPSTCHQEQVELPSEPLNSSTITRMADQRLYKLVKWCKSLPLFKHIMIDDQISLLINAWCELLVLSSCHRSITCPPGVIRVSQQVSLSLEDAVRHGIEKCVEKMITFTDQLRRLKVDQFEYVSMKLICLLTSDASGLKDADAVRGCQEKVVHALQEYTVSHYPEMPSKFGELLLRMPELSRVCQVGKEMLCLNQQSESDEKSSPGFSLLMELLRDDQ